MILGELAHGDWFSERLDCMGWLDYVMISDSEVERGVCAMGASTFSLGGYKGCKKAT
jgi:hypothetical protein